MRKKEKQSDRASDRRGRSERLSRSSDADGETRCTSQVRSRIKGIRFYPCWAHRCVWSRSTADLSADLSVDLTHSEK